MHRQSTLKQRMVLCLTAFFAALAVQIVLSFYQSGTVLRELDDQMGNFNAISRFQNGVERSLTALDDYRWEYGDTDALLAELDSAFSVTNAWLWRINGSLDTVSEEQYLLYSAVSPMTATPPLWRSCGLRSPPGRTLRQPSSTTKKSRPAAAICGSTPSSC